MFMCMQGSSGVYGRHETMTPEEVDQAEEKQRETLQDASTDLLTGHPSCSDWGLS